MTTCLTLCKDKIDLRSHCVFLVGVMPQMIGDCMLAMEDAGIANTGQRNKFRVITWQKPGKFSKGRDSQLPYDVEYYVMCVLSVDEKWPSNLFHTWFNQDSSDGRRPGSSVIQVPAMTHKPTHTINGKAEVVNKSMVPYRLGHGMALAFCQPTEWALFPGMGAGGAMAGFVFAGVNVVGFDHRRSQVTYCQSWYTHTHIRAPMIC